MQPRSRIAKRIDADRDPTNLPVNPLPLLRLHCLHDRGDHRTDRGSLSVDEAHDGKMRPCNRYLDSEPLHLVTTQPWTAREAALLIRRFASEAAPFAHQLSRFRHRSIHARPSCDDPRQAPTGR